MKIQPITGLVLLLLLKPDRLTGCGTYAYQQEETDDITDFICQSIRKHPDTDQGRV